MKYWSSTPAAVNAPSGCGVPASARLAKSVAAIRSTLLSRTMMASGFWT